MHAARVLTSGAAPSLPALRCRASTAPSQMSRPAASPPASRTPCRAARARGSPWRCPSAPAQGREAGGGGQRGWWTGCQWVGGRARGSMQHGACPARIPCPVTTVAHRQLALVEANQIVDLLVVDLSKGHADGVATAVGGGAAGACGKLRGSKGGRGCTLCACIGRQDISPLPAYTLSLASPSHPHAVSPPRPPLLPAQTGRPESEK